MSTLWARNNEFNKEKHVYTKSKRERNRETYKVEQEDRKIGRQTDKETESQCNKQAM